MTARSAKELLGAHGLRPKHDFGQNFLTDPRIAERIAELATSPEGGTVVELGAGLGALTFPLAQRAGHVFAVERDRDLVPLLRQLVAAAGLDEHVTVLEEDAKRVDVARLVAGSRPPRVLAGNLPYQLTGPILRQAIAARSSLDRAVFLVQLEVAERLVASPGTPEWGALSVFTQAAWAVRRERVVRRSVFYPPPRVDSAVVVLDASAPPRAEETPAFAELVRRAFGQRRKTLRNAWRGVLGVDAARLDDAAGAAGIDLSRRGETLDVEAFARMATEVTRPCA